MFKRYKLSKYNILVQHEDVWLLYNQVSGTLIKLNDRLKDFQKIADSTLCLSKFKRKLRKHKFLVPVDEDEFATFRQTDVDHLNNNQEKKFVIVVTSRCNAACFYCYEKECKEYCMATDMSSDVQDQLVRFIDHCISSTPTINFSITWYGGEPLLCPNIVCDLAKKIKDVCKNRGVKFSNNIITNGTLLDNEMIDRLLSINCRSVQITIDGMREIHDARRPLIGANPSSYDIIMENLIAGYSKGLEIDVRSNLDYSNSEQYKQFLDDILNKGLNQRNSAGGIVNPSPAMTRFPNQLGMKQEDFAIVTNDTIQALKGKTEVYRFLAPTLPGCMKNMRFYYTIAPNGNVTKCIGGISDEDAIGTIYDMKLAEEDSAIAISPCEDTECVHCPILPSCGGGCVERHKKYNCEKCHYGGCQTIRWTINNAIVGLYYFLLHRGELGGDKE